MCSGSAQATKISSSHSSPQEVDPLRPTHARRPPVPQRPPPRPPLMMDFPPLLMDFPPPLELHHPHPDPGATATDVDDFEDETEPELTFSEGDYRSTDV